MSDNHKLLSAIVNQNNTSISYWKQLTEVLKKAGISLQLELYMNTLHLWRHFVFIQVRRFYVMNTAHTHTFVRTLLSDVIF